MKLDIISLVNRANEWACILGESRHIHMQARVYCCAYPKITSIN